jgi:hypothetical protein
LVKEKKRNEKQQQQKLVLCVAQEQPTLHEETTNNAWFNKLHTAYRPGIVTLDTFTLLRHARGSVGITGAHVKLYAF